MLLIGLIDKLLKWFYHIIATKIFFITNMI